MHPEVSFRTMRQAPIEWSKKTWNGVHLRARLLAEAGIVLAEALDEAAIVPVDDVLDAAAAAWTARRAARGEARSLPERPEMDRPGRLMAIWV